MRAPAAAPILWKGPVVSHASSALLSTTRVLGRASGDGPILAFRGFGPPPKTCHNAVPRPVKPSPFNTLRRFVRIPFPFFSVMKTSSKVMNSGRCGSVRIELSLSRDLLAIVRDFLQPLGYTFSSNRTVD